MEPDRKPALVIACNLDALDPAERARRATLAQRISSLAGEIAELDDGYALKLPPDIATARDALEWIALESRCCPFLRLELAFEPEHGPLWVRLRGGDGVKAFLEAAGLNARGAGGARERCGCG